jgi:glyoxylase-like metal-dependent hydrolase (beta-lactamase superfamily II)
MDSFSVVIDANILDHERQMLASYDETSQLPIRYVLNSHNHGDHAHGNGQFVDRGAEVVASRAARPHYAKTESDFLGQRERKEHYPSYDKTDWAPPTVWFEKDLWISSPQRKIQFMHLGAAHSPGDAIAWLPDDGILFVGDLAAEGHLNYLGDADIAGWIDVLRQLEELPARVVVPGHGPLGDLQMLSRQRLFLEALRDAILVRLAAGDREIDQIAEGVELPEHPLWTQQKPWFRRLAVKRFIESSAKATQEPQ